MNKHLRSISRFILLVAGIYLATSHQTPVTVFGAFKDSGWGTRPLGMGGAFTGIADDTNAPLYNPAGIWQIEHFQATFMNAKLFTGLDAVALGMNYLSAVIPVNKSFNVGILWANFYSEDQYKEDTFGITAAVPLSEKLSIGVNIKQLSHSYTLDIRTRNDAVFASGNSKSAYAFDAGAQYFIAENEKYQAALGLAVKNLNQPDVGLKTQDIVPAELRIGAGAVIYGKVDFAPAFDISYRAQEWGSDTDKINIHAGCEAKFLKGLLAARAGGNMNEITTGFGFAPMIGGFQAALDYAFIVPLAIKETNGSHRISLTVFFVPPEAKFDPFK